MECNFNPKARTYNPHFHLIVTRQWAAKAIIGEWLACWTPKVAIQGAQHSRPVKDRKKNLVEIIKYSTKIFTEPDTQRKNSKKGKPTISDLAMDNIYKATKGLRIFDRFGFNALPTFHLYKKDWFEPLTLLVLCFNINKTVFIIPIFNTIHNINFYEFICSVFIYKVIHILYTIFFKI